MKLWDRHHVFRILCALSASYLRTKNAEYKMSIADTHTHSGWIESDRVRARDNCQMHSPTRWISIVCATLYACNGNMIVQYAIDSKNSFFFFQFYDNYNNLVNNCQAFVFVSFCIQSTSLGWWTPRCWTEWWKLYYRRSYVKNSWFTFAKLLHVIEKMYCWHLRLHIPMHLTAAPASSHLRRLRSYFFLFFWFVVAPPKRATNELFILESPGHDSFDRWTKTKKKTKINTKWNRFSFHSWLCW